MVELIHWVPRNTKAPVIGVTNRDHRTGYYYLICESDNHNTDYTKYLDKLAIVLRTKKGYHFYFKIKSRDPYFVYYLAIETPICDRGYLTIAPRRAEFLGDILLVLRISPKYYHYKRKSIYDLELVHIDPTVYQDPWLEAVLSWIKAYNPQLKVPVYAKT